MSVMSLVRIDIENRDSAASELSAVFVERLRQYHDLIVCIEVVAFNTGCTEAHLWEDIFLEVHRVYFSFCLWSALDDPDLPILLVLIMPCVITTLLMPCLCARIIPDRS
ncbi:hypothetical protein Z043_108540 [Scleropages formosus]|uniref:Uncharacterized protein n=1 Tax=Scleropages formosus TaxID=113540 RepID=A0A0P7USK9_SCLFO|nr:hypothetical protein Z043_108540 [Scleropages formosus]